VDGLRGEGLLLFEWVFTIAVLESAYEVLGGSSLVLYEIYCCHL
jgi:hypothetical protein